MVYTENPSSSIGVSPWYFWDDVPRTPRRVVRARCALPLGPPAVSTGVPSSMTRIPSGRLGAGALRTGQAPGFPAASTARSIRGVRDRAALRSTTCALRVGARLPPRRSADQTYSRDPYGIVEWEPLPRRR